MSTTTFSRSGSLPLSRPSSAPARTAARPLLLRILDALVAANQRRADREIAAYIRRHGGAPTDQVERGIERSFL